MRQQMTDIVLEAEAAVRRLTAAKTAYAEAFDELKTAMYGRRPHGSHSPDLLEATAVLGIDAFDDLLETLTRNSESDASRFLFEIRRLVPAGSSEPQEAA